MTDERLKRRLTGLALVLAGGLVLIAMAISGWSGLMGRWIGLPMRSIFGLAGFIVPLAAVISGIQVIRGEAYLLCAFKGAGYAVMFLSVEVFLGALPAGVAAVMGGSFGAVLSGAATEYVGLPGALFLAGCCAVGGLWLTSHDRWVEAAARVPAAAWSRGSALAGRMTERLRELAGRWRDRRDRLEAERAARELAEAAARNEPYPAAASSPPVPAKTAEVQDSGVPEAAAAEAGEGLAPPEKAVRTRRPRRRHDRWRLPDTTLLDCSAGRADESALQSFVRAQTNAIEKTLAAFHVDGRVASVTVGSRVILFEWQPAPGVKASRLEQLEDDLALALKAERVRVVVPLPGKGTIGIEAPHPSPARVTLGAIVSSFPNPGGAGGLPLFFGRLLTGETLVADLVEMPHLLIAGTTGSGKSVCIHSILSSLLMTRSPEELRLLLVDPKRVELMAYGKAPHLLFEVITDAKRAVAALRWIAEVMEARYSLLAHYGARDLSTFNRMLVAGEITMDEEANERAVMGENCLPWLVVAVDELADLMVTRPRDVESVLQRLAQMARGVGIHLVVATQRPSVDVLTGVIKANMPSRIAFQVATQVDSRTILDSAGAEQLLGRGDMLYLPNGAPDPVRAQGALVTTDEVVRLVAHWSAQGAAVQAARIGEEEGGIDPLAEAEDDDPMYEEAARLVVQTGEASISMLQRRMGIGFARAGRLVDLMERRGIVGPKQGSRTREITVDRDKYLEGRA